ncbi:hypothetical protein GpartN1_g300.t1 [Galdieria partita]|uniref:MHD domain-containing protein n=1 Tax=Galdieria partita TaxID=83374 RepID=A0A9C7PQT0_9RHOD|nr:hypothetical protein GpartN1_g300.t1 [Galdieria partita]
MLLSLFLINSNGEVIIEKSWKTEHTRRVCDLFWQEILKVSSAEELAPLLHFPKFDIAHIYTCGVFLVATVRNTLQSTAALELLHHLVDTFVDYFGEFNEHAIKENFVTVYEIVEEVLDHGFTFTVDTASLKELVPPPSLLSRMIGSVTGSSLSKKDVSEWNNRKKVSWRNPNIRYAHNEIFVDIIEEVSAILNNKGECIHSGISGSIVVNCRLSGVPELSLHLNDSSIAKHSFVHPCVRYGRFIREGIVSFVPPDGVFQLLKYQSWKAPYIPVTLEPQYSVDKERRHGRLQLTLDIRGCGGKACEEIMVSIPFRYNMIVTNLNVTKGTVRYDSQVQICKWSLTNVDSTRTLALTAELSQDKCLLPISLPSILVDFRIVGFALSGLSVQQLTVLNESYKPYKGLRRITKSGGYEIRPY